MFPRLGPLKVLPLPAIKSLETTWPDMALSLADEKKQCSKWIKTDKLAFATFSLVALWVALCFVSFWKTPANGETCAAQRRAQLGICCPHPRPMKKPAPRWQRECRCSRQGTWAAPDFAVYLRKGHWCLLFPSWNSVIYSIFSS